jgi:hypothetical protein
MKEHGLYRPRTNDRTLESMHLPRKMLKVVYPRE